MKIVIYLLTPTDLLSSSMMNRPLMTNTTSIESILLLTFYFFSILPCINYDIPLVLVPVLPW